MKGRLKIGYSISENEMLAIGTEVEIVDGWCGCDGYYFQCELPEGRQIIINSVNIEITDHRPYIDWEKRRYELAKAAMQGFCSNPSEQIMSADSKTTAEWSLGFADALIKKLKLKKI